MNGIARAIDQIVKEFSEVSGEKYGFAFFMFKMGHGDDHRFNYISNAVREDMIATLKEFIAKNEGTYQEDFTKRKQ